MDEKGKIEGSFEQSEVSGIEVVRLDGGSALSGRRVERKERRDGKE